MVNWRTHNEGSISETRHIDVGIGTNDSNGSALVFAFDNTRPLDFVFFRGFTPVTPYDPSGEDWEWQLGGDAEAIRHSFTEPGTTDYLTHLEFRIPNTGSESLAAVAPPPVGVPELSTLALLGLGLVGMAARRIRKV